MKDVNYLISSGINVQGSLELFGDMDTYNETLEEFLTGAIEKLADIKKNKELNDMPDYAILVHSLKSDSKYLGFTTLAELSYNHEMASKANNINFVYDNYDELVNEANRIINVVCTYLGQTSPNIKQQEQIIEKDKAILVVDDSDMIRNFISRIFNDLYEVKMAKDGAAAIQMVETTNKEIIGMLLDLNMPNVNGFAVLEYLNKNELFTKVPVAIITGDDAKETINKAFEYPIVDVLTKPFNERDLKRVLDKIINYN
ncbi:MAG: response regulator [Bacilli bacterium]